MICECKGCPIAILKTREGLYYPSVQVGKETIEFQTRFDSESEAIDAAQSWINAVLGERSDRVYA